MVAALVLGTNIERCESSSLSLSTISSVREVWLFSSPLEGEDRRFKSSTEDQFCQHRIEVDCTYLVNRNYTSQVRILLLAPYCYEYRCIDSPHTRIQRVQISPQHPIYFQKRRVSYMRNLGILETCECSLGVKRVPSKHTSGVRFPSFAPFSLQSQKGNAGRNGQALLRVYLWVNLPKGNLCLKQNS